MIKKILSKIPAFIVFLLLAWCFVSFIDIAIDNNTTAAHSSFNAFKVFLEVFSK